jgi:hypothetical protein
MTRNSTLHNTITLNRMKMSTGILGKLKNPSGWSHLLEETQAPIVLNRQSTVFGDN